MKEAIKSFVKANPTSHKWAMATRRTLRPFSTESLLHKLVKAAPRCVRQPTFVKVGANDGVTGDPFGEALLRTEQWNGLLIDPVPYCVDRLKEIYSDRLRFTIEQKAVSQATGSASFFYVSKAARRRLPTLPNWYDQLGSFNREHIVKHLGGKLVPFIKQVEVDCDSLDNILRYHQLSEVTLLHIDTEGYDLEVLKSLSLKKLSPPWIMVEHKHLSSGDRQEMIALLASCNYDISDTGSDFFAMHKYADNGLHRRGSVGRIFNKEFLAPTATPTAT